MNSRGNSNSSAFTSGQQRRSNSSHNNRGSSSGGNRGGAAVPAVTLSPKDQADLDSFRVALRELTFNSKPIIDKLTGMARERARSIPGPVSRTILDNLVFNNPKTKSCFLFLIDSICKNVGDPYPNSFVKHGLVSAYIRVYGELFAAGDEGQKRDFLRVLPTWNGIFPPEALKEIEIKLGIPVFVAPTAATPVIPVPTSINRPFSPATLKLLKDLQSVFENPPGPRISGIVSEIFKRLAQSGEVSREVLSELDFEAKMADKRKVIDHLKEIIKSGVITMTTPTRMTRETEQHRESEQQREPQQQRESQSQPQQQQQQQSKIENFELPPNFQIDMSLLSSIVELNKTLSAGASDSSLTQSPLKPVKTASQDRHFIEIPLNSNELMISRPKLFKVLYDDLALHCKTCGVRFRDTQEGHARMTEHLDSHFRRNMRLKEKSKRVMARDWFGSEEDWINARNDSQMNSDKTVNVFEDSSEINDTTNKESESFVEATEDEQNGQVKCDTCQEIVSLNWNDETEQWIFPGCLRNEFNRIVHEKCQEKNSTKIEEKQPTKRQKLK